MVFCFNQSVSIINAPKKSRVRFHSIIIICTVHCTVVHSTVQLILVSGLWCSVPGQSWAEHQLRSLSHPESQLFQISSVTLWYQLIQLNSESSREVKCWLTALQGLFSDSILSYIVTSGIIIIILSQYLCSGRMLRTLGFPPQLPTTGPPGPNTTATLLLYDAYFSNREFDLLILLLHGLMKKSCLDTWAQFWWDITWKV